MRTIVLFVILLATIATTSVQAQSLFQNFSVSVGNKTTKQFEQQLKLIDTQIAAVKADKAAEIASLEAWRASVDTVSEDNYDAEELLNKINSTYAQKLATIDSLYAAELSFWNDSKIKLVNNMTITADQINGHGSAKVVAMVYATAKIYGNNGGAATNQAPTIGNGIVINQKSTPVIATVKCLDNSMLSQTFILAPGQFKEFPAIPGCQYTFEFHPQNGPMVSVTKAALLEGTFQYNNIGYITFGICKDANVGGSYY